ncbi:hypothetical protein [Mesorhizobium cantuariense]|uniref:Uncharacterized protein n=1 Tax=Mesorhizobium cantuariense TaxID=1300275 RepID=A0ABV7MYS2_9HYPH
MTKFKPTFDFKACRVISYEWSDLPDFYSSVRFLCAPVRKPAKRFYLEFVVRDDDPDSVSERYKNFVRSARATGLDDIGGRYFAVMNGGNSADDFGTLEYASACLQCDRERFMGGAIYSAQCAIEEAAHAD